jgi:hypothetical protein
MKKKSLFWTLTGMLTVLAAVGLAFFSTTTLHAKNPNAAQTAQSIMVNLKGMGDYTSTDTSTYRFNKTTAATYFSNAWDGNAPTRSDKTSGGNFCTPPEPETPPPAPAADDTKLNSGTPGKNDVTGKNECSFLDGTALTGDTYTQTVSTTTSCTSSGHTVTTTWTYTYTYNIAPLNDATHPNPPAAFTAWDLQSGGGGGGIDVSLSAEIAGESLVVSKQFPTGKYSFSLFDASSANRVHNLVLTITDANGNTVYDSSALTDPNTGELLYPDGIPSALVYPVDFVYTGNAGFNGTAQDYLLNGYARSILNGDIYKTTPDAKDQFPGNDDGGADGSALAEAIMNTLTVHLDNGTYNVTLTGVVKGNSADGTADQPINISGTISTPGCN